MRWKIKLNIDPVLGDERENGGFLILPKRLGLQYRWLEFARWRERYERKSVLVNGDPEGDGPHYKEVCCWRERYWIER